MKKRRKEIGAMRIQDENEEHRNARDRLYKNEPYKNKLY